MRDHTERLDTNPPSIVKTFVLPVILLSALLFGPERPITQPQYGIPFTNQQNAVVASDGSDYLVFLPDVDGHRIWSAQVSATGQVLTQPSHPVANDVGVSVGLQWTGDHYVAFWLSNSQIYDLKLARLDRTGALLGPVRTIVPQASSPRVAWNGRNFLFALPSGNTVELELLSPDGDVVKRAGDFTLPSDSTLTAIVAVGDTFWIFHSTHSTEYARRVSADGELLDAQPRLIADHADLSSSLASNGRSILGLVYSGQAWRPFLIDSATGDINTTFAPLPAGGRDPQVTTDGSGYLLTWIGDDQTLRTMPFDETGNATPQQCCHGALLRPLMAWNAHAQLYFAVWGDARDGLPGLGYTHVYGTLLDAKGRAADDGRPIASAARAQSSVSAAGSLVVWTEHDAKAKYEDVRASIGNGEPVVLSQPAEFIEGTAAVFTGSSYLAGWTESTSLMDPPHVFMRRVGADAPLPLGIGSNLTFGFDGTNVLAVWLANTGLVGQRFKPDGNIVDAVPFQISSTGGFRPSVAWNGSEYLVTWWDGTRRCIGGICPKDFRDVKAARISPAGSVLQTMSIATGSTDQFDPVVASDGRDFLVVYALDELTGTAYVYGKRVLADGSLIDPGDGFAITTNGDPIQAIWHHDHYVIATERNAELRTIEVDPNTTTVTADTLIAASATASHPFGGAFVAYTRATTEPIYGGAPRVFTKALFDSIRRRTF